MEIFGYQLAILFGVGIASLLFGRWGLIVSIGAAAVWTLAMVFTKWLLVFQFITVGVAFLIGLVIVGLPRIKEYRANTWTLLVLLLAGGAWYIYQDDKARQSNSQARQSVSRPEPTSNGRADLRNEPTPAPSLLGEWVTVPTDHNLEIEKGSISFDVPNSLVLFHLRDATSAVGQVIEIDCNNHHFRAHWGAWLDPEPIRSGSTLQYLENQFCSRLN